MIFCLRFDFGNSSRLVQFIVRNMFNVFCISVLLTMSITLCSLDWFLVRLTYYKEEYNNLGKV